MAVPLLLPESVAKVCILTEEREAFIHAANLLVCCSAAEKHCTIAVGHSAGLGVAMSAAIVDSFDPHHECCNLLPAREVTPAPLATPVGVTLQWTADTDLQVLLHVANHVPDTAWLVLHIRVGKEQIGSCAVACPVVAGGSVTEGLIPPQDTDGRKSRPKLIAASIAGGIVHNDNRGDQLAGCVEEGLDTPTG